MAYLQTAGQTILLVDFRLIQSDLGEIILVHMHHSIEESPEQDISKKTSDKASGEEQPPWFKAFVPPPSSLENEQQWEEKWGEEVKNEAVQSRQPQDASCRSRECRYRGAAVVQYSCVAPHCHFTDELWSLTLGYNSCHVGSVWWSQEAAAVKKEIQFTIQIINALYFLKDLSSCLTSMHFKYTLLWITFTWKLCKAAVAYILSKKPDLISN